jgi:pimeloyl-ACP methyl ester carboxylesterase
MTKRITTTITALAAAATLSAPVAANAAETIATDRPVTNIVLVHGAFADGSGWKGVYDNLTKRGYRVTIVQNPLTSLEDDVAATRRVLERQDGPVILVGHSWGGTVITEAGIDPKVAGLVYSPRMPVRRPRNSMKDLRRRLNSSSRRRKMASDMSARTSSRPVLLMTSVTRMWLSCAMRRSRSTCRPSPRSSRMPPGARSPAGL